MGWLVALMIGCGPVGGDDSDTDTDGTGDTEVPVVRPVPGLYESVDSRYDNDTCGTYFGDRGVAAQTLVWTGDDTFELRYGWSGITDITCALDGPDVACSGFVQEVSSSPKETLTGVTVSFVATETWSYDILWNWTISCEGDGCAAQAAGYGLTYPCTVDVSARFVTPH